MNSPEAFQDRVQTITNEMRVEIARQLLADTKRSLGTFARL